MVEITTSLKYTVVEYVRDDVESRQKTGKGALRIGTWDEDLILFNCRVSVYWVTDLAISCKMTLTWAFASASSTPRGLRRHTDCTKDE